MTQRIWLPLGYWLKLGAAQRAIWIARGDFVLDLANLSEDFIYADGILAREAQRDRDEEESQHDGAGLQFIPNNGAI